MIILGTRPEAIKFAPLIIELKKHADKIETRICITAQHRKMLDQVLDFFSIIPDFDLDLMIPSQSLVNIISRSLIAVDKILSEVNPDLVFVQGDTTTAFVGSIAAAFNRIKLAHLEAGLRSHDKHSPFPEEINRIMTGHIADYHFAPTTLCCRNLIDEGIEQPIYNVGNTVIDALLLGQEILNSKDQPDFLSYFSFLDFSKKLILVTSHRRESFGQPLDDICRSIISLVRKFPDVQIVFPIHPNPKVEIPVRKLLEGVSGVFLIEPLEYLKLIWLLKKCYLVLTDSGGIQEEAPSLGKPVVVLREKTERQEGIIAGTAILAGTDHDKIVSIVSGLIQDKSKYDKMAQAVNPYGDGSTSKQIVDILLNKIFHEDLDSSQIEQLKAVINI